MNELALFAGAGGGILGGHLLGWRTVCAVEIEDYPRRVLLQRQADGILPRFPVWDNVCTFDGKPWRGKIDIISGGFPCQDISAAGKGAGITGDRSGLWGEMARIIGEVRPSYVLVENSPMLTSRGLGTVLGDLATLGYDAQWGVLGADDAGALHVRKRIWIVAYSNKAGFLEQHLSTKSNNEGQYTRQDSERANNMANTDQANGRRELWGERSGENCQGKWNSCAVFDQPEPVRMVDGVANRVDRLAAIGNGQVPAVVELAWKIINTKSYK